MEQSDRIKLIIECERLKVFLNRNQLVQANALCQKIEGVLVTVMTAESKPETISAHPCWSTRTIVQSIQNEILCGSTQNAIVESKGLDVFWGV